MVRRIAAFAYGLFCYCTFFGTFLYAIGFLMNFGVPKSIDSPPSSGFLTALLVNAGLLMLFAVQHSVMARPAFKRMWVRFVPEPVERSTYVLASSLALILLFWQWQPMGGVVWDAENTTLRALLTAGGAIGFLIVLVTTFLLNHFDLFGLRQVWFYLRGEPYRHLAFRTPGFYRFVRHPLYVGWLIAFWVTPTMTAAHLVFALLTTAYMLAAIPIEERDLIDVHGDNYRRYRQRVGALLPKRSTPHPKEQRTPAAA